MSLPAGAVYYTRYQPIVELATGAVIAQAASLHARVGEREIPPAELFHAADDPNDASELDRLGRTEAVRGAAGWLGPARLFIRLVPAMVARPREVLAGLDQVAAEAGVPMRQVVVEVALGQGAAAMEHLARVVARCRGTGCQVAVVDVGDAVTITRTASALAPDFIKLGRSLAEALREPATRPAVDDTIAAAHAVGAIVIAFGVETPAQADWVAGLGADWAQGWLYGRPRRPPG